MQCSCCKVIKYLFKALLSSSAFSWEINETWNHSFIFHDSQIKFKYLFHDPLNVFHGSIIELSCYVSIRWCFIGNSWSMKVVQFNSWAMKHRKISVNSILAFWERKFCCIVMLSAHPKSPGNKSRQIIFSVDWAQPKALKLKQMILPTNLKTLLKRFRKTSRNFCVSIVPF